MGKNTELKQFTDDTTLHGLKYVFTPNSGTTRRTIWAIVVICAGFVLCVQISLAINKYLKYESFTAITFTQNEKLSFPAITLCNLNAISHSKFQQYFRELNASYGDMQELYNFITASISAEDAELNINGKPALTDSKFIDFILNMQVELHRLVKMCFIDYKQIPCSEYFTTVMNDKGLCYTFNSVHKVAKDGDMIVHQQGKLHGVAFFIDMEPQDYFITSSYGMGVNILVHDQAIFPYMDSGSTIVGNGHEIFLGINKVHSKKLSEPYGISCVSHEEKKRLGYFKYENVLYSEEACKNDCIYKSAFDCPHCFARSNDTDGCTMVESFKCYQKNVKQIPMNCTCKPVCENIRYETSVSYSSFPNQNSIYFSNIFNITDIKSRMSVIYVYFNSMETKLIEVMPVLSLTQLMSNFGGLLGLYLGASLITVFEFLDFFINFMVSYCQKEKTKVKPISGIAMSEIKVCK